MKPSRFNQKPEMDTKRLSMCYLISVLMGYMLTAIGILVLTFIVYKFDLGDGGIHLGNIAIIILSTLLIGFRIGRKVGKSKWMHGGIGGIIYFVVFVLVSILVNKTSGLSGDAISLFFMCLGGSVLGGMLG